jgi:hypothetical protein
MLREDELCIAFVREAGDDYRSGLIYTPVLDVSLSPGRATQHWDAPSVQSWAVARWADLGRAWHRMQGELMHGKGQTKGDT